MRSSWLAEDGRVGPRIALSIAGFDPSSGAGVTADLKVFAAHRIYGLAAITALTVQSTQGVFGTDPVPAPSLVETLACLEKDFSFDGIKIGMLASAEIVTATVRFLGDRATRHPGLPIVLDPVLRASSGRPLLSQAGAELLVDQLLPLVSCVTPNLAELAALCGRAQVAREDIATAARELQQIHPGCGLAVLVTGGHLDRPDDYLLTAAGEELWLPGELVQTSAGHGTGCAFSSALLCGLVHGETLPGAAKAAKAYVAAALEAAYPIGHGPGPLHHLFALDGDRSARATDGS